MTRRRDFKTSLLRARFIALALSASLLGACAALPDDAPVVEKLDTETGATISRLGHPIELYREAYLREAAGKFAFLAPFETNQMGARTQFLWLALPIEATAGAVPVIEVNGSALKLADPGMAADFAGLHKSPYKIPTPWSTMYYFKIDAAIVATLGGATNITVRVLEAAKSGAVETTFASKIEGDARLKDFAGRTP